MLLVGTDVMLTDAGGPLLGRQLGLSMFSQHCRYGVGTAVFAPREATVNVRLDASIEDVLVGQAVLCLWRTKCRCSWYIVDWFPW